MLDEGRKAVLSRIKEYETAGLFDKDVEADPPHVTLLPDKIDYTGEKFCSKFSTRIANTIAVWYYENELKKGNYAIKEVNGIENFLSVEGGAVITCNHFSVYDNYAVYRTISKHLNGRNLYKVIKEDNYTNFKGLYGFFFRHCNTLPLSSNTQTMIKFLRAIKTLLGRGEKILIYPEQAMWWNYKKPRPMKDGAFKLAAMNKKPVIPCFITMEDGEKVLRDGSLSQKYTVWYLPPIYPKEELSEKENIKYMKEKNYELWKDLYERVYGEELKYGD